MNVSNMTGESTDYRLTPRPGGAVLGQSPPSRSGRLRAHSFTSPISLPPGGPWVIQFFKPGSRSPFATKTIHDSSCLVVLVETENEGHKILVAKSAVATGDPSEEWLGSGISKVVGTKHKAREYNEERLALLARKYGDEGFSAEDEARLEALTERVRRLLPRVTKKDWQRLEEMASRFDEIQERTRGIRRKYGLSG